MSDTTKKRIGIALCIIFASILINILLGDIILEQTDYNFFITAHHTWGILFEATKVGAILYIAFNRKINSNIFVKIGALLLIASHAQYIINTLSLLSDGKPLIEFEGSDYLIYDIICIASIIIFYWGVKTWLPIKIAATCGIIPSVITDIAYRKLINSPDDYEIYNEHMQSYIDTIDLSNTMFIVIYVCSLLATILWLCMERNKRKQWPAESAPIETKPFELISKIPHK